MGVYNTSDVDEEKISRLMVGRDVVLKVEKDKAQPTDTVLKVRNVEYVNDWGKKMLDKVSFDVRKGEILGVAGVEGNGQKELVDLLFGFSQPNLGTVEGGGKSTVGLNQKQLRDMGKTVTDLYTDKKFDVRNVLVVTGIDRKAFTEEFVRILEEY